MSGAGASGKARGSIGPDRLARLNAGEVEAATLAECLAVDFAILMGRVFPDIGDEPLALMEQAAPTGISRRMPLAAELIRKRYGPEIFGRLAHHPSDTVRGWACFMVGSVGPMELGVRLGMIRPLADDAHFGVREWSWMAVRPHLSAELDKAINLLSGWTGDPSERVRRFASEAIRPRGVWCTHIGALKRQPGMALPVLAALRADPSRYVQDSVGNWLNDAAKDHPDWVRAVCGQWMATGPGPATARICKRALRSIGAI